MKFSKRDQSQEQGKGPGIFLKIGDGDSVTGIFKGELYEFRSKWVNNRPQLTDSSDPEGKPRFRANFVIKEEGRLVAKIWEFPTGIYNKLANIHEEYPLEETKVKITRRGVGTDTEYDILPLLKDVITPEVKKAIDAVPLNVLEHKAPAPAPKASGNEF
jgi:hypothetical protein